MEIVDTPAPGIPENFKEEQFHYRKSIRHPDAVRTKNNLLIKKVTDVKKSVAYCIDLIYNKQYPFVKISAISSNMDKAILIAELLKRKIKNLHQVNTLETFEFDEVYTPKMNDDGRTEFSIKKFSTNLVIKLVRVAPSNLKTYGYQPPLQINLVSTKDPREYINYVLNETREPKKKKLMNQQRRHEDDRWDNQPNKWNDQPSSKRNNRQNKNRKHKNEERDDDPDNTYGKIKKNDLDKPKHQPKKNNNTNKKPKKQKEPKKQNKYDDSDDNLMYKQKNPEPEKKEKPKKKEKQEKQEKPEKQEKQDAPTKQKKKNKKRNKQKKDKQDKEDNGYMRRNESLDYVQKQ